MLSEGNFDEMLSLDAYIMQTLIGIEHVLFDLTGAACRRMN